MRLYIKRDMMLSKTDYEKWHEVKWCAVCGRRISVDDDFWTFGDLYWHTDCVPKDYPKTEPEGDTIEYT